MLTINQTIVLLIALVLLFILTLPATYTVKGTISETPSETPTETSTRQPEGFDDFWYRPYGLNMYTHTDFPFWNTQLGTTRNMSYDLRGDIPIPRQPVGPWLNSSRAAPIVNKPLWMVS